MGKNILSDIFEVLVDGYSAKFKDTDDITSRFNSLMMGKLFVVGDEINARAKEVCNELKDLITCEKTTIEKKGQDKIYINDYRNYFMSSNNENVFQVSNSERRLQMIECPDEKKDVNYYKTLFDFKNNKDKLKHLFNFFMTRDISTFNPQEIILTEYKSRLILYNAPAYIKFIIDKYEKGDKSFFFDIKYSVTELYKKAMEYAINHKLSHFTERVFCIQFKKYFGEFQELDENKRSCYKFPFLEADKETLVKYRIMDLVKSKMINQ